jgi:hypothetical protein
VAGGLVLLQVSDVLERLVALDARRTAPRWSIEQGPAEVTGASRTVRGGPLLYPGRTISL